MSRTKAWRRYGATAQALHWVVAGLIVTQYVLARMAAHLPLGIRKLALLAEHKSVGMTVLILAVIRLAWRLKNPPPPLPTGIHQVERFLARVTHVSFYVLLFTMPTMK
jgi:cytochrome b561